MTDSSAVTTFDVNSLPSVQTYGSAQSGVRLFVLGILEPLVKEGVISGRYKETDSLGFVMAAPGHPDDQFSSLMDWDHPKDLIWLAVGWGPRKNLLIANAARKLRACARIGEDTLSATSLSLSPFESVITPDEWAVEGSQVGENPEHSVFRWGDFPYGGAASVSVRDVTLGGAISGVTQEEDHVLNLHVLNEVALWMWKLDNAKA